MVLVVKDRIKDTTTTTGSGTITLDNSPPAGYQAFSTLGNGSTTYYTIQGSDDSWEIGIGTYTSNTLTRTTILSSSNNGVIINFPSGSHTVWVDYPAAKAYLSEEGIDKSFTSTAGIAAGRPVILNSAGTVTQVGESAASAATPSASPIAVGSGTSYSLSTAYEPTSGKFVISYNDKGNSNYPTIVAGGWNVASGTVTWGTAYVLSSSATSGSPVSASGNGRIHVVYGQGSYSSAGSFLQNLRTATIASDNTFTGFSTSVVTFGANAGASYSGTVRLAFDTSTNYLISTYTDMTDGSGSFYAIPIHINGTTYTTGAVTTVCSQNPGSQRVGIVFDPDTNRTIIVYKDKGNGGYTTANVLQSAGSSGSPSLTMGSDVVIDSGDANEATSISYDTANNKVFLVYSNETDTELKGAIGTVTAGTNAISFTTPASIKNTTANYGDLDQVYDSDNNKIYLVYKDKDDGDDLTYVVITSGASSFSVSSATEISSTEFDIKSGAGAYASGKGAVFSLMDTTSSYALNYITFQNRLATNLTPTNYLGVASTSASANASVNINIPGSINNDQTSLTVGEYYYTSISGVISTTLSPNFIGRAISSTQLLLEEEAGNSIVGFSNGAITKGKPVVMQADGDVAQAGVVASAISPGLGSIATELGNARYNSTAFGKDGQRVTAYRGTNLGSSTYDISLRVATTSTADLKTITWSGVSTLTPSSAGNMRSLGIIYDTVADKYVLIWKGASDYIHGCTLTVSGTGATASVSAGTNIVINSDGMTGYLNDNSLCYDTANSFSIASWSYSTPKTCSLSISGTNLTAGTTYTLSNNTTNELTVCAYNKYHGKVIYMYTRQSNEDLYYNVGTSNSDGTITVSTSNENVFDNVINYSANVTVVSCNASSGETMVVIQDGDNKKGQGSATVWGSSGTLSGTTITFGALTQISNIVGMANTFNGRVLKPIEDNKFIYATSTQTTSPTLPYRGVYSIITVSGTSTSYGTITAYSPQYTYGVDFLSVGVNFAKTQAVIVWQDTQTGEQDLRGITLLQSTQNGQTPNITTENYLGIASDTVADNKNVLIDTQGAANPDQSSLTPAQLYYVQTDGTLSTTAGSPSVVAGIATSATTLLITRS